MLPVGIPDTHSLKGLRRRQYQPLWDRNTVTSASTDIKFFNTPSSKILYQTNVVKAHELPFREKYEIWGIRAIPQFRETTTPTVKTLTLFYNYTALELNINNTPVLQLPAIMVTGGCGLDGMDGYAAAKGTGSVRSHISGLAHNGIAHPGAIIRFDEPFMIGRGETFGVDLKRGAATGLVNFYLWIVLEGYLWKQAQ